MCERFSVAIGKLDMTLPELAAALGYANSTTVTKVMRGESFVDVERLYLLAALTFPDGKSIDLNWIITGRGTHHA